MRIFFLTSHLKERDGASRAIISFSKGIKKTKKYEPVIITLNCSMDKEKIEDIEIIDLKKELGPFSLFKILIGSSSPLKKFKEYLKEEGIYIVASDDLVALSNFKKDLVYWSQGVLISIFFWEPFYQKNKTISKLASPFLWYNINKFTKYIKKYKKVLANSKTSSTFVSLFYNKIVDDIIYPPVDTKFFKPSKDKEDFVLAFVKRGYPTYIELLSKIAKKVKMKVIGYKIQNAEYIQNPTNEELKDLYSSALITLYPTSFEYYGYIPVESMASGTPVIAFKYSGGPSETIINGKTGWLVSNEKEFYNLTLKIYKEGYDEKIIKYSIKKAYEFSIENQTKKLIRNII